MTDASPPIALVIIVAYNAGRHLQRCVDALKAQSFVDWQAVIWDNASTDRVLDDLRVDQRFHVVRHPENIGFAAANNRAAALSTAPFIVTLNPDAFAEPDWLGQLIDAAHSYGADAVASLQLNDDDPALLDGAGDCMSISGIAWRGGYGWPTAGAPKQAVEVFSPCAAAALYRRDRFEALGGFEERFFCYYEDVDLGFRLRLLGGNCVLQPTAIVRHVGSASSNQISGFAEYHGTRNRLWTFLRDMPTVLMPIAMPAHILITAYVLLRSPTRETRAARWRGLRDGWRNRTVWLKERRSASGIGALLRNLSWSPIALSRRGLKTSSPRPLRASDGSTARRGAPLKQPL